MVLHSRYAGTLLAEFDSSFILVALLSELFNET